MRRFLIAALWLTNLCFAQDTLKLMHYNILRYGDCSGVSLDQKDNWLRNIVNHYQPDVFTVNEMLNNIAYANRIKSRALTYAPMQYTSFGNSGNSELVNMLFYNSDKIGFKRRVSITGGIRDVDVYTLYHKRSIQPGDTLFFDCIVAHLKAGNSTVDQNERQFTANLIMNWIAARGTTYQYYLLSGDFNIYSNNEAAWQSFVNHSNPSIRFQDPLGLTGGWGPSTVAALTQSTRNNASDCGSGGGLNDRFDASLASLALMQGGQIQYVEGSYAALGNDGRSVFNGALSCSGLNPVPNSVCLDLIRMSDHLPVVLKLAVNRPFTAMDPAFAATEISVRYRGAEQELWMKSDITNLARLCISDLSGREVFNRSIQVTRGENRFPLPELPAGMYILSISAEGKAAVRKRFVRGV